MHSEDHEIDRHDAWMYQSTSQQAGAPDKARFYYDDHNNIDEKKTYSKRYYEQLHPKEEAKAPQKEIKEKKQKKHKEKKEHGWGYKIATAPFRFIWWLFKKFLSIFLPAFIVGLLSGDEDNK